MNALRPSPHLAPFRTMTRLATVAALCIGFGSPAAARDVGPKRGLSNEVPREFEGVDVKNKLGESVDPTLSIVDHEGRSIAIGDLFDGERAILLTLNYYTCKSACSVQLNSVTERLAETGFLPGEAFRIVTVSFDLRDTTDVAHGKRETYTRALMSAWAREEEEDLSEADLNARAEALDWTFATADGPAIKALLDNVGYSVRFDEDSGQYAHSPVVYLLSPTGKITQYLWGLDFPARDLKLALMDATDGKLGDFGDKILASCFAFDPDGGGYSAFAFGIMKWGAGLVALLLGLWLFFNWRRERRARAQDSKMHRRPNLGPPTSVEGTQ